MKRLAARLLLALHVVAVWALALGAWHDPLPNWDILPYTALTQPASTAPADLLRRTYADVRAYVGNAKYAPLLEDADASHPYRSVLASDPAALADNLRFYSVKPLYVLLSKAAAGPLGSGSSATVFVSAIALALAISLFPFFFRQPLVAAAATWPLFALGAEPLLDLAKCATPDTLGLLFVTCCALAAVRRAHWVVVGLLGALAVLARPDTAFIIVPLLLGLAWLGRGDGRAMPLVGCAAVAFALFVLVSAQAPPWPIFFWHSFVQSEPFPSRIVHHVTVGEYLAVVRRTVHALLELRPLAFLVAGLLLALAPFARTRAIAPFQLLAAVAVGNILLHYAVYPMDGTGHERMYIGSYLLIVASVLLAYEAMGLRGAPAPGSARVSPGTS